MDAPVPLRPRDIQARIRAGATAEEVAEAAGSTVDKVLVYARPVLAERAHMAQRAQRSSVRRSGGDAGHRILGDAVAARLRGLDEDPTAVEWDSRKREDGRWVLTASYTTADRGGLARFTFDPPGNFVLLDDDDARWLVGDDPEPVVGPESDTPTALTDGWDDDAVTSAPRLVAVADDELPLGGDALRLVAEPTGETDESSPGAGAPAAAASATEEALEQVRASESSDPVSEDGAGTAATPPAEDDGDDPRRKRGRKRGRASVPSWDEIMFGGRKE